MKKNSFSLISNTNLQLIQYKTIQRTHITQYKMHKMGLATTDICSQCTTVTIDNYFHALWACQPIHSFWNSVTKNLSIILDCRIPSSPQLCLLGGTSTITIPNKYKNSLLISFTCNMVSAGEGHGPLSVAVSPLRRHGRQHVGFPHILLFHCNLQTIPSQVATALVITRIHALTHIGRGSYTYTSQYKIK